MIRIHKPDDVPEVLRTRGKNERRSMSVRYTRYGERSFDFDSGIYGDSTVKQALIDAQHGKCCFCESKVTHVAYGDVEHFRPKKGYRQQSGDPLGRPGYYWLAYEWSNLLFACQLCNQRHKRNLFPLRDPRQRATSHHDDLSEEEPLFIHPARDDPESFIGFRAEIAYPKRATARSRTTIEALGLNREALSERRKDHYERLKIIYDLAERGQVPSLVEDACAFLQKARQSEAEYAAMTRAAVKAEFEM